MARDFSVLFFLTSSAYKTGLPQCRYAIHILPVMMNIFILSVVHTYFQYHTQLIIFLTSSKCILHLSHFQEVQIISSLSILNAWYLSCCHFQFYHLKNMEQSLPLMYKWLKMFSHLFCQFLCSLSFSPSLPSSCRFRFH